MCSGKTSVAKHLAHKMSVKHIDLDDEIQKSKKSSISELFEKFNEIGFRNIENKMLNKILKKETNSVISLGGGTPCYYDNMKKVCFSTKNVFYLKSTNKILANRLFNSRADRPLISRIDNIESMLEFVSKHMFERSNFYEMAHYKINTVNKGIEQISNQIKSIIH